MKKSIGNVRNVDFLVSEEDTRKQYETAQYITDAIEKYLAGGKER